jgi:hypothetical protein
MVDECVSKLEIAASKAVRELEITLSKDLSGLLDPQTPHNKELRQFFVECTRWHAEMISQDPILELLPKKRIPNQGSPVNNLIGLQYEFNFGGNSHDL